MLQKLLSELDREGENIGSNVNENETIFLKIKQMQRNN